MAIKQIKAVSYLRTSSMANADGDSQERQRRAIKGYAKRAGFKVVEEFADMAVSGVDPIESRAGFAALLDRIEGNGVRTVIIEDASRLARQLMTQELAIIALIARGVTVMTASGDVLTDNSDPSRTMMRQVAGAFHQYEKTRLVAKLRAARDSKRATGIKVEGRKQLAETFPEATALAKQLNRDGSSLRQIAAELHAEGHVNSKGKPFSAQSISNMLK